MEAEPIFSHHPTLPGSRHQRKHWVLPVAARRLRGLARAQQGLYRRVSLGSLHPPIVKAWCLSPQTPTRTFSTPPPGTSSRCRRAATANFPPSQRPIGLGRDLRCGMYKVVIQFFVRFRDNKFYNGVEVCTVGDHAPPRWREITPIHG